MDDFNTWAASAAPSSSQTESTGDAFNDWASEPVKIKHDAEYFARSRKAGVSVGRTAEEHAAYLAENVPGLTPEAAKDQMSQYRQAQSNEKFKGTVPGGVLEQFARDSLPVVGDLLDLKGHKEYDAAKKRIASGQQKPEDYDAVARYERLQQIDQEMGARTGTAVIKAMGQLPKIAGEAWLGGKVMSAAGGVVGGRAGSFLAGTNAAKNPAMSLANPAFRQAIATHAGRMAILTPLMPSMYVDEARQRNLDEGRAPDDIRGFPAAMLHGYSNMLVLGTLQKNFGGATWLGRQAVKGGVGVGEQAVADVAGGLWDEVAPDILKMKTRYGTIGSLARGDVGDAMHHATVQFLTFAAFAGLHDQGKPSEAKVKMKDEAEFFAKDIDKGADSGKSVDAVADVVGTKAAEKSAEAVKADPVAERAPVSAETAPTPEAPAAVNTAPVSADRGEVAPSTPASEATATVSPKVEAEIRRTARNVFKAEHESAIADGKTKSEAASIAAKAAADWEAGARARAAKQVEAWVPAATKAGEQPPPADLAQPKPPVQPTPEPPRIAQAEQPAPPSTGPAKPEIVQPAASSEPVSPETPAQAAESQPPAAQAPEAQTPAGVSARLPASAKVAQAIANHQDLPPAQKAEYAAASKAIFEKMPTAAHDRMASLGEAQVFQDTHRLGMKVFQDLLHDPTITPEQRSQVEDKIAQVASGDLVIGGSYTARLNAVYIDGKVTLKYDILSGRYGTKKGETVGPEETHAHEYGHVIDGPQHELSKSAEWQEAWKKEIKLAPGDKEAKLTYYAHTKASEGFAEFTRLLYGTDLPTRQIAKDFPLASKFFKDRGLWPKERGVGSTKEVKLTEIFDERIPDDEKQPTHADATKQVLERAPTIERSEREVQGRAARLAVRRIAEEHGLTDLERDILLARTERSGVEVARRSGKTKQAISAREINALSKLPPEVADRVRQLFVPDKQGAMLSKATEVDAQEASQAVSSINEEGKSTALPAYRQRQLRTDAKENEYNKLVEEYATAKPERKKAIEKRLQEIGDKADFMRLDDEPMTETERQMLAAIHEEPLDNTRRMMMADAVEEGGTPNASKRSAAIRSEIENPPFEKGVSHSDQLHSENRFYRTRPDERFYELRHEVRKELGLETIQHLSTNEARDAYRAADREAERRFYAEQEAKGERLTYKLPSNPDQAFPEGHDVPLSDFGPRLHSMETVTHTLRVALGQAGLYAHLRTVPVGPHDHVASNLKDHERADIEISTEDTMGPDGDELSGSLVRNMRWRERYDRGDAEINISPRGNNYIGQKILSVTLPKDAIEKGRAIDSHNVDELLASGWRRVELDGGRIRLDSPLRQRLREQQARGLRTGEPQFLDLSLGAVGRVLDRAVGEEKGKETRSWLVRQLTAAGNWSAKAFEKLLQKDQSISAYAQDTIHAAGDLTKAVGGDWRAVPKSVIETMNAALQDKTGAIMATFSPEVRIPLTRMRNEVDALSTKLIESGALSEEMKVIFKENIGSYLTRQYRAFSDPKWFSTLQKTDDGKAIINRFKSWFAAEAAKAGKGVMTDEELDGVVEGLLKNDTAYDNPISFVTHSKLGSKDIGILTKRKEIPEPLRELWGEVKDPIANYAASVGRMANLLENHVMLSHLKQIGAAEGWLSPPDKPMPNLAERISDKGDRRLSPLAGWRTTKEIREAFEGHYHKEQLPEYLKAYMKVLGLTKYAKTVLSPIAHLRQTLGNVMFNIKQGHGISAEANKMIREMVKGTKDGRDYHRRLIELGIDFQSVLGGEFKAVAEDAMGAHDPFTMSTKVVENSIGRWLKKGLDLSQKAYRYEDLVVKIHAFENEKARYEKAGYDKAAAESKAAEIVQRTFPTYSRIPGGVKWLRRFPLIGPFVSFTSEVVRTTYQTAKLAREELKSGNPELKAVGARRVAGMAVSLSAFAALSALTRSMANVTLQEEDAMRRFLPEWNKDSNLLHLGRDKDGKPMVIDLGRTDPHSYLLEPLQAGLTGARSGTFGVYDTLEPALKPFIGEEIGTRTALDIARNKMEKGGGQGEGKVYNPEAPVLTKGGQIGAHILKGVEPGLVDQILRTGGAAAGLSPEPGGKVRSVGEELLADFSGQRVTSVDAKQSLHFAAKTYEERMKNAEREVNQLVARNAQQGVRLKPEDVQAEFERGEGMRRGVFEDLMSDVQAARMLGLNDGQIAQELRKSGVSQDTIAAVLGGRYAPRKLGTVLNRR